MNRFAVILTLLLSFCTAKAKENNSLVVRFCDDKSPTNLEYFDELKVFANKSIRVFQVDTDGEPACCSRHLIIYVASKEEPSSSKCFHVASTKEGLGFGGVRLNKAKASYDSKKGLSLSLPFLFYNNAAGVTTAPKNFTLIVNQADQSVVVGQ